MTNMLFMLSSVNCAYRLTFHLRAAKRTVTCKRLLCARHVCDTHLILAGRP
jgi:hypothetical protein